ncbi:MAG: HlyD family efflux transporter periplasmic adaptor subunit [Acidobacteriota bacterium]
MSWPRLRQVALAGAASTAIVAASVTGCGPSAPELPFAAVERRHFTHQVRAEGVLRPADRTVVAVPQEVERSVRLAWLAEEGTLVKAGDVVARFDQLAFERLREDSGDDVAAARSQLKRVDLNTGRDLGSLRKDSDVADLELDHAQRFLRTDNQVFSRRDILEDAIDEELAQDRKTHAADATVVRQEVSDKEKQVFTIEETRAAREVDRAAKGLDALEVRAPHAGILTLKRDWQGEPVRVGSELWRGQEIAEIPALDAMEAEVWVLEADAGGLEVGLAAEVTVEAHPDRAHAAEVLRMEALAKPKRRGSPVQYFGVTLGFERTEPDVMKPGQRVRATLLFAEQDDALVIPRQAVVRDGGEPHVWVRRGDVYDSVPVTLGPVSPGLAVIEEGLEAGDTVALTEPPPSLRSHRGVSDGERPDGERPDEEGSTDAAD